MKITMFDAGNGDCILIQSPTTNILVDGGTADSFNNWYDEIKDIGILDALFITHIDSDHTNGIIKLLEKNKAVEKPIEIKKIYFNGIEQLFSKEFGFIETSSESDEIYDSLNASFEEITQREEIGFNEGTSLSYILKDIENINLNFIHNKTFDKAIEIGDFSIEIISPPIFHIEKLKESWMDRITERNIDKKVLTKKHSNAFETYVDSLNKQLNKTIDVTNEIYSTIEEYADSEYEQDSSLSNATSFSCLFKCSEKSFLMLGDAHIETIVEWMNNETLSVDAIKVSHHGSKFNINKDFLDLLDCNKYLISTNGKKHKHPDLETLSRIAKFSKKDVTNIFINNKIEHITDEILEMFMNYKKGIPIHMGKKEINL
ncbi:MAG: MBL fold metallo-hydrolase [Aliarcobacter sp.]|jgi:beta-lactamase superfamily II metal-dependent hydrolase|nr:MBL fold metallo-hydrolase [Aliarcobacter sp.]